MDTFTHQNWIEAFTAAHGRAPRILHVGNINNNAYQTAKMLTAHGADCDVLCADYYYIMANPEWDDAELTGEVGNRDFPAFHKVDLGDFQRPRWFAQGPRKLAIEYLLAHRANNAAKAGRLWHKMERARRYLVFRENSPLRAFLLKLEALRQGLALKLDYVTAVFRELFQQPEVFNLRLKARRGQLTPKEQQTLESLDPVPAMRQKLAQDARRYFPDRAFVFGGQCDDFIRTAALYRNLFDQYDIVQAYATDPVWPYLTGYKNYVAYEHGTLRDTPYEDNDLSRLTLLAYAAAKTVYVTNVDCYDSAVYITRHSATPLVCGLHGFDTERMMAKQQKAQSAPFERTRFAAPDERLFFCPARVDIDPHYGTYLKKNDLLFKALGKLYREHGGGFRILQLDSGQDVASLKKLIHDDFPEMESAITWHPPFQKAEYYQILQNAELVFDNLLLPLMSGNGIETLMSGHAALVNKRIPDEMFLRFFPEMWPILPVDSENDIYNAGKLALENPAACKSLAKEGQRWILRHHGHAAIVQRNLLAYSHLHPFPERT